MVSTHVLTAAFALPLLALVLAFALDFSGFAPRGQFVGLVFPLLLLTGGYVGGTFYSLSYLRRVAVCRRPQACILPSIIVFTAFAAGSLAISYGRVEPAEFGILTLYYAVITLCFAFITRRGFLKMAAARDVMGFPVRLIGQTDEAREVQ